MISIIIKVSDIPKNFYCIYKINYPNGKIYIGQSSDLKRRMLEHNNFKKAKLPCDLAIKKYGKIEEIEILEEVKNTQDANEKEKYWINFYKSNNRNIGYNLTIGGNTLTGENSPKSIFTNEEVLFIRKSRFEGERKRNIYNSYFLDKNFGTFEKIWLGIGYPDIGKEYLIPKNSISKREYSSKANSGENNAKAKLKVNDVLEIRKRYDNGETIKEIHKNYCFVSESTIRKICKRETWKTV